MKTATRIQPSGFVTAVLIVLATFCIQPPVQASITGKTAEQAVGKGLDSWGGDRISAKDKQIIRETAGKLGGVLEEAIKGLAARTGSLAKAKASRAGAATSALSSVLLNFGTITCGATILRLQLLRTRIAVQGGGLGGLEGAERTRMVQLITELISRLMKACGDAGFIKQQGSTGGETSGGGGTGETEESDESEESEESEESGEDLPPPPG